MPSGSDTQPKVPLIVDAPESYLGRAFGALAVGVLIVMLLVWGIVHTVPHNSAWDDCAKNFRDAVHQNSVITGSPEGDVDGGVVSMCGPKP